MVRKAGKKKQMDCLDPVYKRTDLLLSNHHRKNWIQVSISQQQDFKKKKKKSIVFL